MKIKTPKFMRKFIAKRISKIIFEDVNIRNNIDIETLVLDTKGENYTISMAVTVDVNKRDTKQVIKETIKGEI